MKLSLVVPKVHCWSEMSSNRWCNRRYHRLTVSGCKAKAYGTVGVGNSACDFSPELSPWEWQPLWDIPAAPSTQVNFSEVVFCPQQWTLLATKKSKVVSTIFARSQDSTLSLSHWWFSCLFPLFPEKLRQTVHYHWHLPRMRPFFPKY